MHDRNIVPIVAPKNIKFNKDRTLSIEVLFSGSLPGEQLALEDIQQSLKCNSPQETKVFD